MTQHTEKPAQIDTSRPHSARFWNYLLDGKDHYLPDQELGDYIKEHHPVVVDAARASRRFLARSVRHLVEEAGIRQFLDIGTGLPTANNTHEVAQRHAPESRIVYVDNDPVVLLHARALLTSTPEGATAYVEADVAAPDLVLEKAAETLDFAQPVALMLLSMLGHVADPDEAAGLVQHYMSRLSSGSHLVVCDSIDSPEMLAAQEEYAASGAVPYIVRTREQIAATAAGLTILPPGIGPVTEWHPDSSEEPLPSGDQYGFVARKP
ncbi:SAM-dependent methyltransferase [Streptomyces millisiae]|uniref:SAM-dependent methyltransferase n=1 Tax=Streptomyces millisiae TaxID=3075542 RepID=A0ABU2LV17_9ACTN|nr:SAM-dependent methyltransferase [Streptomyces sp. DSM 44918]MDT0321428.1 SAM-dependent methyltransferase [Streptomyces sp. DSM 44918]